MRKEVGTPSVIRMFRNCWMPELMFTQRSMSSISRAWTIPSHPLPAFWYGSASRILCSTRQIRWNSWILNRQSCWSAWQAEISIGKIRLSEPPSISLPLKIWLHYGKLHCGAVQIGWTFWPKTQEYRAEAITTQMSISWFACHLLRPTQRSSEQRQEWQEHFVGALPLSLWKRLQLLRWAMMIRSGCEKICGWPSSLAHISKPAMVRMFLIRLQSLQDFPVFPK